MLIRIRGGSGGISQYLADGQKSGRDYSRDELDHRLQLHGNLEYLDIVLASFDLKQEHEKYLHITLSFKEHFLSDEILSDIDKEFREFIFSACADGEFCYYSEAHLPKIKSYIDTDGNEHERFPHIHVVIPLFNQISWCKENPLGKIDYIKHYINAFQEHINNKYQLESPKNNRRKISSGQFDILNRYKLSSELTVKEIKEQIAEIIKADESIRSVDDLAEMLSSIGKATVRDSKSFEGRYINFKFADGRKAINLKDLVFLDAYLLNRDSEAMISAFGEKEEKLIKEWQVKKSFEARFVDRKSAKARAIYYAMSEKEKMNYLAQRMAERVAEAAAFALTEESYVSDVALHSHTSKAVSVSLDAIPRLEEIPHIEAISGLESRPHFEQMLNNGDHSYESTNTIQTETHDLSAAEGVSGYDLHDMHAGIGNGNPEWGNKLVDADILHESTRDDMDRSSAISHTDVYRLRTGGAIDYYRQYGHDAEQRRDSLSMTEQIKNTDLRLLLDYLAYRYRIRPADFKIVRNSAGWERIQADGKRYSASDFMAKYLHLPWPEIRQNLEVVWGQQERGGGFRQHFMTSQLLWHGFRKFEETLPGLAAVHTSYRLEKAKIHAEMSLRGNSRSRPKESKAHVRLRKMQRESRMRDAREKWAEEQKYYRLPLHERYLAWLHQEANNGDEIALRELNRVYPEYQTDDTLALTPHKPAKDGRFYPLVEMGYAAQVNRRGQIEYRDSTGKLAIVDAFYAIKVVQRDADTIAKALMLARQQYGVDGFEIRNARAEDRLAIQEAVNRVQVSAKLQPQKKLGKTIISQQK